MQSVLAPRLVERDQELFKKYSDLVKSTGKKINYGTAGFRSDAKNLDHVILIDASKNQIAFRCGVFLTHFGKLYKNHVVVYNREGAQITASHNPKNDNGIKLVGPNGNMIKPTLEKFVDDFANTENLEDAVQKLKDGLSQTLNTGNKNDSDNEAFVLIGYDTRQSSPHLASLIEEGLNLSGGKFLTFKEITTPQLHYMGTKLMILSKIQKVIYFNQEYRHHLPKFDYDPKILLQKYYDYFGHTAKHAFELLTEMEIRPSKIENYKKKIIVDCSNGVGGIHQEVINKAYLNNFFDIYLINTSEREYLNQGCGSEFVQKEKKIPNNLLSCLSTFPQDADLDLVSLVAFDGDADRIVYYKYTHSSEKAELFEGDKLGAVFCLFMKAHLDKIKEIQGSLEDKLKLKCNFSKWSMGVAYTGYANGAAQKFFKDNFGENTSLQPTGVKYLHPAAEKFDIGIFFEANGHGTILYHHHIIKELEEGIHETSKFADHSEDIKEKVRQLNRYLKLVHYFLIQANQGTGDAITNFIQIEIALCALKMTNSSWAKLYSDLPNSTSKIVVKNRLACKCSFDEVKVISPPGKLQEMILINKDIQVKIDEVCAKYECGRAFLRPSGTEDVCRLYAEAKNLEDIAKIEKEISEYVIAHKELN